MPRKDQYSGCLIGQALGDALGCPVEGRSPEVCSDYVDRIDPEGHPLPQGRHAHAFGQYTDDSQLARELLQSYVECGRFDPADYARRIARIFEESRIVGRGRATNQAAIRLILGVPWTESGIPAPSAGNGSAMRAAPIGLIFYRNPEQLVEAAIDQGVITHKDPRCGAGSVAIAGATALAMRPGAIDPDSMLDTLADWTRPVHEGFADALLTLKDRLALPTSEAAAPISQEGLDPGVGRPWHGISPFVISSVLWSLYAFLRTPTDYLETIRTAIAVGGDVDTTAAMAGALSGAHLGLSAIPEGLAVHVNDRGTWGYDALVELAEHVYERVEADV